MYSDFTEKIKNKPDNLTPVFSIEGGAVIENDSDRVFELQNDGIRFLTLAWNGENAIAGGINSDKCLTDFGKEVIEKMNRLKMGCDLSHLNKESFYKVLEFSEFSLATHSNCKEICDHPRNLELAQIKFLFEKNGISHSAIMLLKSQDGVNFEFIKPFLVPQRQGNSNWMAQYVYACCLTYYKGKLRLYFNARNVSNNLTGRECIGIYEAII